MLPEGYVFTGEERVPRPGDTWLRPSGEIRTWDDWKKAHPDGVADRPRPIVRKEGKLMPTLGVLGVYTGRVLEKAARYWRPRHEGQRCLI